MWEPSSNAQQNIIHQKHPSVHELPFSCLLASVHSPQQGWRCPSCVSPCAASLPFLLPQGWDVQERHKKVGEGSILSLL